MRCDDIFFEEFSLLIFDASFDTNESEPGRWSHAMLRLTRPRWNAAPATFESTSIRSRAEATEGGAV